MWNKRSEALGQQWLLAPLWVSKRLLLDTYSPQLCTIKQGDVCGINKQY